MALVLLVESDRCIELLWDFVNKYDVFYTNLIFSEKMWVDIPNYSNLILS